MTHAAATDQAFKGKQEAEALRAEGRALDGQISTMSSASQQADGALKELVALYDDGNLRSMIDGVVGKVLVRPGSVVRPGEPMIEIVGKHRFVVAWLNSSLSRTIVDLFARSGRVLERTPPRAFGCTWQDGHIVI